MMKGSFIFGVRIFSNSLRNDLPSLRVTGPLFGSFAAYFAMCAVLVLLGFSTRPEEKKTLVGRGSFD